MFQIETRSFKRRFDLSQPKVSTVSWERKRWKRSTLDRFPQPCTLLTYTQSDCDPWNPELDAQSSPMTCNELSAACNATSATHPNEL